MEELLKELISGEELPSSEGVTSKVCEEGDLTKEQQELIAKLYNNLETAYNHAARACSSFTRLSRSLSTQQLQTLLQASIRPLIQLNALPKFIEETATRQEAKDHPDDRAARIIRTITPDAKSQYIRKEKMNSPT